MKASVALGLSVVTAATLIGHTARAADNLIGLTTPNGRIAHDFIDMWFNQHKPRQAFDTYVSRTDYMNHSMISTRQKQDFASQRASEARMTTKAMHFEMKQLIAQGDLVFAHILATGGGDARGDEMMMFLRIRDGKVVDHWDLHWPMKDDSAVFAGLDR
jgi:predicted SnoaL-like aldol condensation-catalyzing enzyme